MAIFNLNLPERKLKAYCKKHVLNFEQPAGTSRGVMREKESYLIYIEYVNYPGIIGIGECSPLWGLSIDPREDYESLLRDICEDINNYKAWIFNRLVDYPSIYFGLEMALKDLEQGGTQVLFPSNFTQGKESIEINGLVWMGKISFMEQQIEAKLKNGYDCIKLKIGSLNFEDEVNLLREIRKKYAKDQLSIRLDANGAFAIKDAIRKLEVLSEFDIHSIEQPIKAGHWKEMKLICANSPIPIALDEELIGIVGWEKKEKLVKTINPQYLILKPSLVGGFKSTEGWINIAKAYGIKWWVTSALESNVGLNAIAQFTYATGNKMPQGLGTGSLYSNNIGEVDFLESKQFHYRKFEIPS
jgi:O-succinylbenzoate synthase